MRKIFYLAIAVTVGLTSCRSDMDPRPGDAGTADFTQYIAIGNSLTAGYADNSLYRSGQENSYPAILAQQFALVGGGEFRQPLLPGNAGWPAPKLILGPSADCQGTISLGPVPYAGTMDTVGSGMQVQEDFDNYGVPGIRAIDMSFPMSFYGNLNPYAGRMFGNTGKNLLQILAQRQPTFFSVWMGNNDVLGYATNGGEGNVGGIQASDISPVDMFRQNYEALIKQLMEGTNAKGVLINIPDITSIPFFTTVPINGLVLTQDQANQLSAAYSPLNIKFHEGANNFIIQDPNAPGGMRQIKDGEFLILTTPQDSLKCGGWGSLRPIPKQFVLSADEVENVQEATRQFNDIIAQQAIKYDLPLVDANGYIKTFKTGMMWDGVGYNLDFVTGGLFSLDGVHLNPRGYAMMANQIIRTINSKYGATIPLVEVNSFNGLLFP